MTVPALESLRDAGVKRGLTARWPEVATALAWLLACALLWATPVSHDVVWQLWIARQLQAGTELYTQIQEVNPPLWYWMAVPIEWLARSLRLDSARTEVAVVLALAGISLVLVGVLVRDDDWRQRGAMLLGALLMTIVIPSTDFAQREHLAAIGALPYALLLARRVSGRSVSPLLALAIGLFAAPVLALKHYFVLLPVLLELWLVWKSRRAWRPIRPETVAMALVAAAYGAAVMIWTPAYLTDMVPLLAMAYGEFRPPILAVILTWMVPAALLGFVYAMQSWREFPDYSAAAAIMALAFGIAYLAQAKGWSYHAIPVFGALALMALTHMAASAQKWSTRLAGLALLAMAVIPALAQGPYRNEFAPIVRPMLSAAEPGAPAFMLTTNPSKIWPMNVELGLEWPSRYFHFWMLNAVARFESQGQPLPDNLAAYADRVRQETVDDLLCNPPEVLIADRISVRAYPSFDILAFFTADPRFAALMAAYAPETAVGSFTSYRRVAPLPPSDQINCLIR